MDYYNQLQSFNSNKIFKKGDLLVVFGELFQRGYANGLVEEAKKKGLKIIGLTVGRRTSNGLRALSDEELEQAEQKLGGTIINIPLEAGFDMEKLSDGQTLVDKLNAVKFDSWTDFKIDEQTLKQAQESGQKRFQKQLQLIVEELKKHYQPNQNVLISHIMAGGVPRSKLILVIANRVFKGRDDRHIPSSYFWNSGIGKIVERSFNEVTANTFKYLLEATASWREEVANNGKHLHYCAYGYHGCEVLIDGQYQWQTYTPYQQGHAKKLLEKISLQAHSQGIKSTVFNCPEIRTNSSDIFMGVELSLYPFLLALSKECSSQFAEKHWSICQAKLKENNDLRQIIEQLNSYFNSKTMSKYRDYNQWPLENDTALANLMVSTSEDITCRHISRKDLITDYLSSEIIAGSGRLIFDYSSNMDQAVTWIGHKIIAQTLPKLEA